VCLFDPESLFDTEFIHLVHDIVDALAVDRHVRRVELLLRPGIWHLFDGDDDVHLPNLH